MKGWLIILALTVAAGLGGMTIARIAKPVPQPVVVPLEEPAPGGHGLDSMFQGGTDAALDDQVRRQRALPATVPASPSR